ncbi:MAG: sulfotransferase [Lysobacterales bacterium 66-474]|nr:MAG: sulfotransferase [Rhodanobacter sp. SCN 66-43]OJY85057.1 MAG: sulfotransferase [Xanthomonadales bacterium 66-474]
MTDPIVAAIQAGDPHSAGRQCRDQLLQTPDDAGLLVLLALSLWQQGEHAEALEIYARLTRLYPEGSVHWRNYAATLRKAGDLEASERAYATAVRLAPDDAELLELHGLVQMDLGRMVEASETLLAAFGRSPDSPSIRIHAALACAACRDLRAENLLRPWRQWLPLDDYLHSQLAEAHAAQNNLVAALELMEELSRRRPEERRVRLRLAGLYERMNRIEEAEAVLEGVVVQHDEADTDKSVISEIAHLKARFAERRGGYAVARDILERTGPRNEHDFTHWFELAHACDRLGDASAAMAALQTAHSIQIEGIKAIHPRWFEPNRKSPLIQKDRVSQTDYAKWPALQAPDAEQSPVFVMGFPRSGTTLLEQMLDAHPRLQSMDERPFFHMLARQLENSTGFQIPLDLGKLSQRDCDELRMGYLTFACSKVPRRWDAQLVDKNPMNMLWLPLIHRLFPSARYIFALRHPCDVLLSNYMQNFMASTLAATCADLETLATGYVEAMRHWLYHVEVFKPAVFVSRYEDLVARPAEQAQKIASHLGLEDAETMLGFDRRAREKEFIATPSYTQVIEPINTKGMGRWQRYREYFEPVLPILAPMLEHWGYTTEARADATEH